MPSVHREMSCRAAPLILADVGPVTSPDVLRRGSDERNPLPRGSMTEESR